MSTQNTLSSLEALEMFREYHADLSSVEKIIAITEPEFVKQYATDFFKGDTRKARQAYSEAKRIHEQVVLLWANIKDTVASPHLQEALFNNIPDTFIKHQQSIPGYDRLFGNLDFIECDHCRSIFGPAAYFVDLLRFIEKNIPKDNIPTGHCLESRQPRLFRIPLDRENTYNLIPYIDLINEVLEDIVRASDKPNPYQVVEDASFPMQLPFHLPLEEIRTYLTIVRTVSGGPGQEGSGTGSVSDRVKL
jgi:hypothetical protein